MRRSSDLATSAVLIVLATGLFLVAARGGTPAAGGLVGHSLGVLGTLLMLAGSFGYSWRKWTRRSGPGSLDQWLSAHVVAGIVGPYLVLLHTAFAFRGLAGIAFILMAVVVASGLIGRFAYTALPKQSSAPARRERDALLREAERIDAQATVPGPSNSWAGSATDAAATALAVERRALATLAAEKERAVASAARHERARGLLAWWWILHVPLALAMFVLAAIHTAAALYYATLLR